MFRLRSVLALLPFFFTTLHGTAQAHHPASQGAADSDAGATVFQHYCTMCHSVEPGVKIVGPSLYAVMKGPHANSASTVRGIIAKGKGQMPPMGDKLAEQDIANLLAYLRKL